MTEDVWASSFHPGNTNVTTVTLALLTEAVAKLPTGMRAVRLRADGAFYDHKPIEWCETRSVDYVIVARLTRRLQQRISALRYRPIVGSVEAAEFPY